MSSLLRDGSLSLGSDRAARVRAGATGPTPPAPARTRAVSLRHVDGLDGLRGLAVIAVVLYHGGVSWASGGFLGVELFFVLSGFLITSLLIREWLQHGAITLRTFWARRARRLLPALFVLVVAIGIYSALQGPAGSVPGLFGDGISALFYYSNWHQIANGSSYFAQSGPTSPFQHTWSLAIEEQFYLLWPLLVLGAGLLVHREARIRTSQRTASQTPSDAKAVSLLNTMLVLCVGLLVVSAVDTLMLFHGGSGQTRVYFGTDTRATGLLSGAALATTMARLRLSGRLQAGAWQIGNDRGAPRTSSRRGLSTPVISLGSAAALTASGVLMVTAEGSQAWLYPWGFLLVDTLTVALIAVVMTTPRSIANRIFTTGPLRWTGKISYGLYLWHFPLFLWLDQSSTGLRGFALLLVRLLAALAASIASYFLIEQPVRTRRWPVPVIRALAPLAAAAGIAALAWAASAAAIPNPPSRAPLSGTGHLPVEGNLARTAPACALTLANSPSSGAVPPPRADESSFQTQSLSQGAVTWPAAHTTKTFHACPPGRVLLTGDSIAFTIGVPYLYNEQSYGIALTNAASLGCAFATRGELDINGSWQAPSRACDQILSTWADQAGAFGAQEIIVEMGYRDEFDWRWDGRVVHLGQPSFDAYEESQIRRFVSVLSDGGRRKLLFLTVPYVNPPAQSNGSPAPQASSARHHEINALIREAARSDGTNAQVLDIDADLSPQGHYSTDLNGQLCRFDGIHVTVYCSEVLEPDVLGAARSLLGH